MLGHGLAAVEGNVLLLGEAHRVAAQQRQRLRLAQRGQLGVDGVGIDGVGRLAHQAEDDAAVGAVALAGGAERAIQFDAHAGDLRHQAIGLQAGGEHQRGAHRADRVRAGRADADLEEVENRNSHGWGSGGVVARVGLWPPAHGVLR